MKGFLIAFAAIVALTHARPQGLEFTAKDYAGFQAALGDRIPVAIQSAIRVLATVETNPTEFVVLNFNGLSGPVARTGLVAAAPAIPGGIAIARTGLAAEVEDEEQEEVVAVEMMDNVRAQAVVQAIQEAVRRKRQNIANNDDEEEEEERVIYANNLALAFSGLGSLYVLRN